MRLSSDLALAIEEQHPQQPASGIEEMPRAHRDDADRAGVAEGSGGHGWAAERHRRHAPATPALRVSPCAVQALGPAEDVIASSQLDSDSPHLVISYVPEPTGGSHWRWQEWLR